MTGTKERKKKVLEPRTVRMYPDEWEEIHENSEVCAADFIREAVREKLKKVKKL